MVATPQSAPTRELGYATNATSWWSEVAEETTPELRWPNAVRVFDQMRRQDAQVKSILRAVTLPVRRTAWRIEPGDARPEVVALVAEDLGLPVQGQPDAAPRRSRDRFSWRQHLELALLSLPFGHMYFEQVYRLDDSGKARLRKLAPRMPRSISAINVATDGGLISIEQYPATLTARQARPIPVSRLVGYVFEQEAGDWRGQSILRAAYKNWLLKDRLLRVQAQTVERNGMGIPLYEGAEGEEDLTAGRKIAQGWRSGDASGAAIPFGAKLTLAGVMGVLPDADKPIRYHDEQIARTALAHFLNLGTQTGSWALGTTLGEFFTLSLQTLAENVADVANQHIVEDLVDLNYGVDEPAPRLVFDEIGSQHAITAAAMKQLIEAGAVSADPELEQHLRQTYGLPPRSTSEPADPPTPEDQ
jgi:hypothetical protein